MKTTSPLLRLPLTCCGSDTGQKMLRRFSPLLRLPLTCSDRLGAVVFTFTFIIVLAGCSPAPVKQSDERTAVTPGAENTQRSVSVPIGQQIVSRAKAVLGTPYRFGGTSPSEGFDCSGLIYYTYHKQGIEVPRTSQQQADYSRDIALISAQPGDILFFKIDGKKVSHAGIYAGNNQFIHAPKGARTVSYAELNSYWRPRLFKVGRLH